jgi:hypothetical protein
LVARGARCQRTNIAKVIFSRVSNIDQRVALPSRHTATITAPPNGILSVTESSVVLPPVLTGGIYTRSTNAYFIASRGGAASLP